VANSKAELRAALRPRHHSCGGGWNQAPKPLYQATGRKRNRNIGTDTPIVNACCRTGFSLKGRSLGFVKPLDILDILRVELGFERRVVIQSYAMLILVRPRGWISASVAKRRRAVNAEFFRSSAAGLASTMRCSPAGTFRGEFHWKEGGPRIEAKTIVVRGAVVLCSLLTRKSVCGISPPAIQGLCAPMHIRAEDPALVSFRILLL